MNLRRTTAALAVSVLHTGAIFVLMKSLGTVVSDTTNIVPISLTFLPTPPPPLPYLPQFGQPQFGAPPSAAPRLQGYAPLPEVIVPFVPPPSNAITLPDAERLPALGRMFGCAFERFDSLTMEEKLRCGQALGRSQFQNLPQTLPLCQAALWEQWSAQVEERFSPAPEPFIPCPGGGGMCINPAARPSITVRDFITSIMP